MNALEGASRSQDEGTGTLTHRPTTGKIRTAVCLGGRALMRRREIQKERMEDRDTEYETDLF